MINQAKVEHIIGYKPEHAPFLRCFTVHGWYCDSKWQILGDFSLQFALPSIVYHPFVSYHGYRNKYAMR